MDSRVNIATITWAMVDEAREHCARLKADMQLETLEDLAGKLEDKLAILHPDMSCHAWSMHVSFDPPLMSKKKDDGDEGVSESESEVEDDNTGERPRRQRNPKPQVVKDPEGFYKTLGVDKKASSKDIRRAYRSLALQMHPDKNPGRDTSEDFKKMQATYEVLSNDVYVVSYGWSVLSMTC